MKYSNKRILKISLFFNLLFSTQFFFADLGDVLLPTAIGAGIGGAAGGGRGAGIGAAVGFGVGALSSASRERRYYRDPYYYEHRRRPGYYRSEYPVHRRSYRPVYNRTYRYPRSGKRVIIQESNEASNGNDLAEEIDLTQEQTTISLE